MTKKTSEVELEEWQRIGATIRELRLKSGWRADDFAAEIGISRPYLSNIEAGRKAVTKILVANIAKALDCKPIVIVRPGLVEAEDAA